MLPMLPILPVLMPGSHTRWPVDNRWTVGKNDEGIGVNKTMGAWYGWREDGKVCWSRSSSNQVRSKTEYPLRFALLWVQIARAATSLAQERTRGAIEPTWV